MSTNVKFLLVSNLSTAQFKSVVPMANAQQGVVAVERFLNGFVNGARRGSLVADVGAVQAVGKLVLAGLPTAADTFKVANVTFTAGTAAGTTTFVIGTSATVTAANIVTTVGSHSVSNTVTPTSTNGTVTFTAVDPGVGGNGLQLSSALTNGTSGLVAFASGSNGTVYDLTLTQ